MKLLSVVIPMFNVEQYVERCIRSLLNQDLSYEDYEIICVNDGSPDKSRDKVIEFQKEYRNIVLIDQENQGVSVARNKGADAAHGKYILFVDPDDYIVEKSLGAVIEEALRNKSEMAIPGYKYVDNNYKNLGERIFTKYFGKVFKGIDSYFLSRREGQALVDSAVGILFDSEFLSRNKLQFLPLVRLNQDVEFLARVHCIAGRCIYVSRLLYVAVIRLGSATRSNQFNSPAVRAGFILAASNIKEFQLTPTLNNDQRTFLNGPIIKFVLLALYSSIGTRSIKIFRDTIVILRESNLSKLKIYKCSTYRFICGFSYNISPYFGAIVLLLYLKINTVLFKLNPKKIKWR